MKVISEKNVLTIVSGNVTLEIGSNEFDSIDFIKNIQRIIAWEE